MTSQRVRGRPPHTDVLTPAEWRVVEAVRHGMTNPGIALRLGVSTDAVKFHVANAMQKLSLGSRTDLRHWKGIRRDSKLSTRAIQMEKHLILGPIGQIARGVKDINAARQWYGEILGLRHLYSFGSLAFFDCGGVRLFLSEGEGTTTDSIIYFQVDDIRSAHTALTGRDVTFVDAPHIIHTHDDGTEEWMAFFKDNEDRPLGIMSQVSN